MCVHSPRGVGALSVDDLRSLSVVDLMILVSDSAPCLLDSSYTFCYGIFFQLSNLVGYG